MSRPPASDPGETPAEQLVVHATVPLPVPEPLVGRHVDLPEPGPVDELVIAGWVLAKSGPCERVVALADDRRLGHVRPDLKRPDIQTAFPDTPRAEQTGFRLRLGSHNLAAVRRIDLAVELDDGRVLTFWSLHLAAPSGSPTATDSTAHATESGRASRPSSRRRGLRARMPTRARSRTADANGSVDEDQLPSEIPPPGQALLPERLRVVALISAYNEADIISPVLEHLGEHNVESYLIDDGSTDGTGEIARDWLGRGLIGIERHEIASTERSSWRWILQRKQQLARELGADWYIHHDADEIRESPLPCGTLRDAITWVDQLGFNAIDFRVMQFWPVDDTFRPGHDPRTHFVRWGDPAEYDVMQRKAWKAGVPGTTLEDGGHDVRFPGRRLFPIRFPLRHYPIRSQAHGARKVLHERKNRFVAGELDYGWHRQYDEVTTPDHLFLRNPATLQAFDLEAIRLEEMLAARDDSRESDRRPDATPTPTPVSGFLEQVTPTLIVGWARHERKPGELVNVDLWDGGRHLAEVPADQSRSDLDSPGSDIGGFTFSTPRELLDGRPHWIWATVKGTGQALRRAPLVLHAGGRLTIGADAAPSNRVAGS